MTTQEQFAVFSDTYKDVHGRRPSYSSHPFYKESTTEEERMEMLENMLTLAEIEIECQEEAERNAEKAFEKEITRYMEIGASSREQAVRWMLDAYNTGPIDVFEDNDAGYVLYKMGMSYNSKYKELIKQTLDNAKEEL